MGRRVRKRSAPRLPEAEARLRLSAAKDVLAESPAWQRELARFHPPYEHRRELLAAAERLIGELGLERTFGLAIAAHAEESRRRREGAAARRSRLEVRGWE